MGKCSLTFILTKFHVPTACIFPQPGGTQQRGEEKPANLAVPGGNRLGVVTAVEAVNAVLKFLADQSLIFPAALSIGQPHPLAQVFRVIRGCFATVCWKICKKAQTSAPVVEKLNHKHGSQAEWTTQAATRQVLTHRKSVERPKKMFLYLGNLNVPWQTCWSSQLCLEREGMGGLECWRPAEGAGQAITASHPRVYRNCK